MIGCRASGVYQRIVLTCRFVVSLRQPQVVLFGMCRDAVHSGSQSGALSHSSLPLTPITPIKAAAESPFFSAVLLCDTEEDAVQLQHLLSRLRTAAEPHLRFVGGGLLVLPSPSAAAGLHQGLRF